MFRHSFLRIVLICLGISIASHSHAELTVDITKGTQGAMPIAIVPFGQAGFRGEAFADIIASDLAQSGQFSPLSQAQMPERPTPPAAVSFPLWQSAGQEHVVIGRITSGATGGYEV